MINLTEKPPDLVQMEIKMHLPQTEIFEFLQKKGYEVKAFPIHYPAKEEFLLSEPATVWHTFTATKPGESQNPQNQYLKVFENEFKQILKALS